MQDDPATNFLQVVGCDWSRLPFRPPVFACNATTTRCGAARPPLSTSSPAKELGVRIDVRARVYVWDRVGLCRRTRLKLTTNERPGGSVLPDSSAFRGLNRIIGDVYHGVVRFQDRRGQRETTLYTKLLLCRTVFIPPTTDLSCRSDAGVSVWRRFSLFRSEPLALFLVAICSLQSGAR